MNNNEKIEFLARLERRDRLRRRLLIALFVVLIGGVVVYANYKHNEESQVEQSQG